jgi:hypothetical protein
VQRLELAGIEEGHQDARVPSATQIVNPHLNNLVCVFEAIPMGNIPFGKAPNTDAVAQAPVAKPDIQGEPRRSRRTRTLLKGKLAFGHGAFSIDCVIRDISKSGAHVRIQPGLTVPRNVFLVHLRDRTAFEAIVRWRRNDGNFGLEFNAAHDLERSELAEMKLLRRYCVDAVC